MASDIQLPDVPVPHRDFTAYLAKHPELPLSQLVSPYNEFEGKLREVYAQSPDHPAIQDPHVNIVPVFNGHEDTIRIRARDPASDAVEAEKFIMPLKDADRKPDGAHAIVNNLKSFKDNFNLFSESSLVDLDWSNIVVAGSAVVTSLLPVPEPYNESKRALREYVLHPKHIIGSLLV